MLVVFNFDPETQCCSHCKMSVPFMKFQTDTSDQTCIFLIEGKHRATYLMIEINTLDCLGKNNVDLLFAV